MGKGAGRSPRLAFLAVASAIDRGGPAGKWSACRPFHKSGAAAPTATAPPRSPGRRARPSRRRIRDGQLSVFHGDNPAFPNSAGARRPSAECVPALLRIASMRPNRSGAASSRAAQARAPASRCPCAAGTRFPPGRLNGAGESGRTRKGRRPAPTPLNETNRLQGRRARASRPQRPRAIAPRGPSFPSREAKEGPAVSGGPLGYPWWSLGGSNP